jgi:hypothetical protein
MSPERYDKRYEQGVFEKRYPHQRPQGGGNGPEDVEVQDIDYLISFSANSEYSLTPFQRPLRASLTSSVSFLMVLRCW